MKALQKIHKAPNEDLIFGKKACRYDLQKLVTELIIE
jgi:hypothetical protein